MNGLDGRNVIVSGGASGIGKAIAERLAAEGCRIAILDLSGDKAESVAASIRDSGGIAHAYHLDITDYDACDSAIERFETICGPLYGLVNNAGWDIAKRFVDSDRELWKKVIDINLYGPLNLTHLVLKRLAGQGAGRIVTISSDAGRVGSSGEAVYSAAKGGVIALMKTLAREHAKDGLTFNTICPGPTDTPLLAAFDESGRLTQALARAIPLGRLGRPEDYPGLVAFLLSDDASFITGQTISVSGGLSMNG
jgi:2-hydroxycyclohexanecarboxyl-CoA dehydrogenase